MAGNFKQFFTHLIYDHSYSILLIFIQIFIL